MTEHVHTYTYTHSDIHVQADTHIHLCLYMLLQRYFSVVKKKNTNLEKQNLCLSILLIIAVKTKAATWAGSKMFFLHADCDKSNYLTELV